MYFESWYPFFDLSIISQYFLKLRWGRNWGKYVGDNKWKHKKKDRENEYVLFQLTGAVALQAKNVIHLLSGH